MPIIRRATPGPIGIETTGKKYVLLHDVALEDEKTAGWPWYGTYTVSPWGNRVQPFECQECWKFFISESYWGDQKPMETYNDQYFCSYGCAAKYHCKDTDL